MEVVTKTGSRAYGVITLLLGVGIATLAVYRGRSESKRVAKINVTLAGLASPPESLTRSGIMANDNLGTKTSHEMERFKARLHADRVARCHCHYRHSRGAAVAHSLAGQDTSLLRQMQKQSPSDWCGDGCLCHRFGRVPASTPQGRSGGLG